MTPSPKFSILIRWSEEDQGYVATVPLLPGVSAVGNSPYEAADEIVDALEARLASSSTGPHRTIEEARQRRQELEQIQPDRDPALCCKEVEDLARDIDARIEALIGLILDDVQRLCGRVLALRSR